MYDPNKNKKNETLAKIYWRTNLIVISSLLAVWAIVAYVLSILLVEKLNQFALLDLPLGFWIANQGSMYLFVVLILAYALIMDRVNKKLQRAKDGDVG